MSKPEEMTNPELLEAFYKESEGMGRVIADKLDNGEGSQLGDYDPEESRIRIEILRRLNAGELPQKTHRSLAERENDCKGYVPPSFGFGEDANSIGEQRDPGEPANPRCPKCNDANNLHWSSRTPNEWRFYCGCGAEFKCSSLADFAQFFPGTAERQDGWVNTLRLASALRHAIVDIREHNAEYKHHTPEKLIMEWESWLKEFDALPAPPSAPEGKEKA